MTLLSTMRKDVYKSSRQRSVETLEFPSSLTHLSTIENILVIIHLKYCSYIRVNADYGMVIIFTSTCAIKGGSYGV